MIALLDVERGIVTLYGDNGSKIIPFREIENIKNIVDERVYYITAATEVNVDDVVSLVQSIDIKDSYPDEIETGESYIHSSTEETIVIDEELSFKGKFDIKAFDDEMKEIIEDKPLVKQLIKMWKIEIIGQRERKSLSYQIKEKQEKEIQLQKIQDEKLDAILVDRPAAQVAEDISSGKVSITDDDAEVIDMEVEDDKYQTENEKILAGLEGIKDKWKY